ncbi:PAS domain S-box protein [Cytophagaceae bacterium YF14B1]|uniref:Oxygen sensor histidine kinase NreB n=1 Tax=Xanthocytophaga flava TaxID=3048013 RepID=A0AAE3QPP1_9BACT|nr:PAS domain S-box protein [Xanthocytophaga flavus]MDJ1480940.1 PAS domain S-box protein [Xanthocytophaga flavus]
MKSSPALSEEVLKVFQALPDLYLILSVDLVILTASDAYLKATFTKREQITGKFVFDVFPDNPVATGVHAVRNLAASFRQVLATKRSHQLPRQQYDVPLPGKEAGFVKKYWLPLNTPVLDEFGDIHYIIHRVEDVTEQTLQEVHSKEALQQSEDLFHAVLDSSLDMIQVFESVRNGQGEIVDFVWKINNKTSQHIYGGVIGKRLLELNPGVIEMGIFDTFKQVVDTGIADQSKRHYVYEQFDGWFYQSTVKFGDGVATTTTNITKLKQSEFNLQIANERLQAVLDSSLYVIQAFEAVRDETGKIVDFSWIFTNQRWKQLYGDEMLGKKVLQENPGVVQSGLFDKFVQVTETGVSIDHEQYYTYEQFDGWFHQTLVKMGDGFVMNTEDITRRKQIEQELKESRDLVQTVFDVVLNPIAYHTAVRDASGEIIDFEFLLENREAWKYALEHRTGKRYSEAYPGIKDTIVFRLYCQVVETGNPLDTEVQLTLKGTEYWFHLMAARLGDGLVATAVDITERKITEAEIIRLKEEIAQKATDKYQALFNSIDEGFAIQELLTDDQGNVTDLIYREVNESFEQHTGMKNALGRKVSEFVPHLEKHWLDALTQVYHTGRPLRNEGYTADLNRWLTYQYSRIGGAGSRLIAVVFNDITERKQREQQQQYLLRLNDSLSPLADPMDVQRVAMKLLGEQLQADRVVYANIDTDQDYFEVIDNYANESVQKILGRFPFAAFGPPGEKLKNGKTLIIHDVSTAVSDEEKQAYFSINVHAVAAVPLIKNGKLVADLSVHQATPRNWRENEIALIQATAERTWAAVEKAKAEKALRESQKRLQSITNLVPDLLWDSEPDGSTNWYNHRWLEYTGQSFEQAIGWGWTDTIHPDDRESSAKRYGEAVSTGKPLRQEHRIRRHDGEYRWFVVSAWPLSDSSGHVVKVYGAATDIHDRKQAEETLRESEDRKAFLLKLSDALHPLYDSIEIEHTANKVTMDYFGSDRCYYCQIKGGHAIIYRDAAREGLPSVANVYPLHTMPIFKTVIDVAKPFIVPDVKVTELVDESLRELCVSLQVISFINIPVIKDNNPVGILCIVQSTPRNWTNFEVSLAEEVAERTWGAVERARAEANLRENEEQFRRALEEAPIPIIMHAEDGEVLQISRSWTELTGYSLQEVPSFEFWLTKAYGQGADQVRSHMQHLFEGHVRTLNIDFPILTRHGQLRHWSFSASSPGVLRDGRRFIVGMAVDITERLQTQMQLQEFNTMLERQVSERTKELEESRDLLQSVFDTSLMGMSVMKAVRDENGNIVDFRIRIANKEIKRETGRMDLEGKLYAQEFPGIQQVGIYDIIVRVVETGKAEGMEYYYPFEGFNKWFTCMFVKLEDGVVATNLDITERKLVELELHKRLMILQQAEQVAAMGSWEYDLDTKSFYWSEGMYRLFSLPLGSQIPLEVYLDYVDRQDHPLAQKMVDKIRNGEGPFEETLHMIVDQKPVTVKVKSAVMYDTEGKPMRVVGVDLDISELKRLEEENIKIQIEQQKQLLLAILEAQEEERRRISESLHNGVGQILYATKLNLNQLELYLESNDKPMVQKSLRATEAMLVDAIAETRRASHELVPILLKEYGLDKAIKDFCTRFSGSGIEFACHGLEERFPDYLEAAIYRIAQELANNIVKHSGATRARIEVTHDDQFIYVEAQDNGKGIQTPKPDSSKSGKGIGMKTIEDRVKLLEGTIEIESAPGNGTLITIILPLR